jgi:hypothetical protein
LGVDQSLTTSSTTGLVTTLNAQAAGPIDLVATVDSSSRSTTKTVTTSGSGFLPGVEITLTLQSPTKFLGKVYADANGSFTFTATLDAEVAGDQTVVAEGIGSDNRTVSKRASFNVKGIAVQNQLTASPTFADLAFTGANSILIALVALGLLLTGSFLLRKGSSRS